MNKITAFLGLDWVFSLNLLFFVSSVSKRVSILWLSKRPLMMHLCHQDLSPIWSINICISNIWYILAILLIACFNATIRILILLHYNGTLFVYFLLCCNHLHPPLISNLLLLPFVLLLHLLVHSYAVIMLILFWFCCWIIPICCYWFYFSYSFYYYW